MLKLLLFFRVVSDVPRDERRRDEANRTMDFNQPYTAVEVEAKQLPEEHVVFVHHEGADQLLTERTGGSKVLRAQIVLLYEVILVSIVITSGRAYNHHYY